MYLSWVELRDFRGYHHQRLEPDAGVNVLAGANGAGKTNFIESVGYLASLRSFRGASDADLVRGSAEAAYLRAEVERRDGTSLLELELVPRGRRRVQVNRSRLARNADLLGHVRAVVFQPNQLDVIKRGPGYRRDFVDTAAVQLWQGAYADQQEMARVIRQRNALLRQDGRHADPAALAAWNTRLSQAGAIVVSRRSATIEAIEKRTEQIYRHLAGAGMEVSIDYRPTWNQEMEANQRMDTHQIEELLLGALEAAQTRDMERRVTTVGPHRDDLVLLIDGSDARTRASQGEQRSLAVSLTLAAHDAVADGLGDAPLLLLDDVFSELDTDRAVALADLLPEAQTFVTTARREEVPLDGKSWQVDAGTIA